MDTTLVSRIALLVLLVGLKHFLADWQFQTKWMVSGKRRGGFRFVIPLSVHAGIHGLLMFYTLFSFILLVIIPLPWENASVVFPWRIVIALSVFDFSSHFIIDKWKATMEKLIPSNNGSKKHKYWVGLMVLDQAAHAVVYLIIIKTIFVLV